MPGAVPAALLLAGAPGERGRAAGGGLGEMEREPVTVQTTIDTLYRLDFGEEDTIDEGVLQRIICKSEKMSSNEQILYNARGLQLLDVNNEDVEAAGGLDDVIEDLVKSGKEDVTLFLVQCQNPEIEARQKKSAIAVPAEVVTDLREDVMTPLLKKKSIAKVPLGSVMYLNHPNWKLTGLGSLLLQELAGLFTRSSLFFQEPPQRIYLVLQKRRCLSWSWCWSWS